MTASALDFASFYSEQKWEIFPCKPHDKVPLVKWADVATSDMFQIAEWWSKFPDANIGLATGKRSGLFALDVDAGHSGIETLQKHVEKYGQLPHTPTSNTGGGGYHYLFQMPDVSVRNTASRLGMGLDTRGNGGYIVVPQSIHPNGKRYMWQADNAPSKTPIAAAPPWLLEMLTEQEKKPIEITKDGAFPDGQRHYILVSMAGSMRRRGMTTESIFQALWAENLARCVPPAPEENIRKIAESMELYPPTAAPALQNRDRATAEWSFCKTIYESPEDAIDFQFIQPDMFIDKKLAEYWGDVLSGMGVGQAAANAEILTDLEKYSDWALPRLGDYATNIKHYSHMSRVSFYGHKLQKAAENGDYEKIDHAINEINSIPPVTGHVVESITDVANEVESAINERAKNPVEVWGIPYRWKQISKHTGGKQIGELTLLAGEPKIGKSFWKLEDVLYTAVEYETPVFYWCGEMKKTQLMRRFYSLLGVNSKNMKTGNMTEQDWDMLKDAKALILNSPVYIDDKKLSLHEIRPMLKRMKSEHGIQEFVIDYASKVIAPGQNEIEQTSNVSKELKQICMDLEMAGTMIASVNKQGMDGKSILAKSNVRGSGQQIHDADLIYQITTFPEKYGINYGLLPDKYQRCIALNISAGRELEDILEGGFIPYEREEGRTSWKELTKVR